MNKNELRVIRVGAKAIEELLLENLVSNYSQYFDIDYLEGEDLDLDDAPIFMMQWDSRRKILTYAIARSCDMEKKELDYEKIAKLGFTTTSFFGPGRFRSVNLNEYSNENA